MTCLYNHLSDLNSNPYPIRAFLHSYKYIDRVMMYEWIYIDISHTVVRYEDFKVLPIAVWMNLITINKCN